ncbi:ribosome silencing factor [Solitalea koreensis]|uniref:Ribosomal silencing factor RsfS n=1 Tax=Solitalea koreensis TaxID=543615 RepID=A0A521CNJ0_9SPHI|nr:ribosome silencing factor [Solitalea koreensis]SMO60240.1 ribosome-associated protein [Solitalea koreensis]
MVKSRRTDDSQVMSEIIIHGIQEKKGNDIVRLDLRNIKSSVTDYFIICDAESTTQVRAIADSIEHEMFKALKEEPWQKEGFGTADWILLDYVSVVVHIFRKEKRYFYGVEELWGDAEIKTFQSA